MISLAGCGQQSNTQEAGQTVQQSRMEASEAADAVKESTADEPDETNAASASTEIQTNGGEMIAVSSLEHEDEKEETTVYYTSDISPQAMLDIYAALGQGLTGDHIAVKLSTGEPPASNYLDPNLIADLVHQVNGTIVENNTAYGGQRSNTAMHYQVAKDHGFTDIADVAILDENGSVSLPVEG